MSLNSRSKALASLLLQAERPLTSKQLAAQLRLTPRIVRYNLDAVERWLATKGISLTRKPNYGFDIDAPQRAKVTLLRDLRRMPAEDIVLCPIERVHLILLLLFTEDQPLLIKQLWGRFRVSRSTVVTDLHEAEQWLHENKLSLLRRANFGFELKGREAHIRQALVSLLRQILGRVRLLSLCTGQYRVNFALPSMGQPGELYLPSIRPVLSRLTYTRTLVNLWEDTTGSQLTDDGYLVLALYTAVMMERISRGKHAQAEPERLRVLGQWRAGQPSKMIVGRIEHHLGCKLSDGDIAQLELQLGAARVHKGVLGTASRAPTEQEIEVKRVVDAMLDEASSFLHPWLKVDRELRSNLTRHLLPAWNRLKAGLPVSNPLLQDIKEFDGYLYQVARRCARILGRELGTTVPPGEVGYIAMHLAAAMERARPPQRVGHRVLVICGEGSATAWLLVSRLRAEFPNLEITAVVPARRVNDLHLLEVDAIVSTVPLGAVSIPVQVVSPVLGPDDVSRLRELFVKSSAVPLAEADASDSSGPPLCDLVTTESIALGVQANDWGDVIDRITGLLMRIEAVDMTYARAVKAVIEAHGPYMVTVPGVALLHTKPGQGVHRLAMAMITLADPVAFGHPENDPVDLAFALAAVDQRSHRRALLDLVCVVRDPSVLVSIREAPSPEDVSRILTKVSEATDVTQFLPES